MSLRCEVVTIHIRRNIIIHWSSPTNQEAVSIVWPKQNRMKFAFWLELNLHDVVDPSQQLVKLIFFCLDLRKKKNNFPSNRFIFIVSVGPLCLGKHPDTKDRRLDDTYATFKKFNRTLRWSCESGDPAILQITPNTSWPDTVYYNSFTHANMGWKIHIVDSYNKNSGSKYHVQCIWIGLLFLFII